MQCNQKLILHKPDLQHRSDREKEVAPKSIVNPDAPTNATTDF